MLNPALHLSSTSSSLAVALSSCRLGQHRDKRFVLKPMLALLMMSAAVTAATSDVGVARAADIYPVAILPFQEKGMGVKGYGEKVSELLFANLAADPSLYLVDRADLDKLIKEQELGLSGAVRPGEAAQVGNLSGAKLLVVGSVIEAGANMYLVAKIIVTETSRVLGATVKAKLDDDLAMQVEQLAEQVAETIRKRHAELVAPRRDAKDLVAALHDALGNANRPSVAVVANEQHVGQATVDPAIATEMTRLCTETGFAVFDPSAIGKADLVIKLEGLSEFAGRVGEMIAVKARVELQVVDRNTDRVIVADRQTTVVVDLAENISAKAALQQATATLAERALPKLVNRQ